MSYNINLTDGTILGTILDGTNNTTATSLTLVGRNYSDYGQVMTDNLVALLENFSSSTAPGSPLSGQLWWDKTNKSLKVYTGTTFKIISGPTASTVAPATTTAGDLWLNTTTQQLHVYVGTTPYDVAGWILVGPAYSVLNGKSGAIWETITDNSSVSHNVLSLYLDGARAAIISKSAAFTPNVAITNFPTTIVPGTNISNVEIINGTALNAQQLDGTVASNYMRADLNNVVTGSQTIVNNNGINIGANIDLSVSVPTVGNVSVKNNKLNGSTTFYSNVAGVNTQTLHINGATGRVEVAGSPTTALGISTKQYVDDKFVNTSLTGIPTAPTAATNTNTTQLATTAFTYAAIGPRNIIYDTYGSLSVNNSVSGTGLATLTVDGRQVLTASTLGVFLANGATATTQLQAVNNATVATTAYVRTAVKLWDGAAKWVSTLPPTVGVNDIGSKDGDIWFQYQA